MTVISIDIIHGDHLAHAGAKPLSASRPLIDPDALAQQYVGLTSFRLNRFMGDAVYEVRQADTITLVAAHSGARLSPLNEETARPLAQSLSTDDAPILTTELVTEAPQEVGGDRKSTRLNSSH